MMTRTAPLALEDFDPEILDAARDVARRAGVPVETWIASIVSPEKLSSEEPSQPRRRRRQAAANTAKGNPEPAAASPGGDTALLRPDAKSAAPVEKSIGKTVASPATKSTEQATAKAPSAAPFNESIAEMLRRLDAIDNKIAREHAASQEAASRTIAGIEARISSALDAGLSPATQMADRLGQIERRMTELGEQLAAPRPLGRRGRPVMAEIRDAVAEIRQRQQELDGPTQAAAQAPVQVADAGHADLRSALTDDVSGAEESDAAAAPPTITELQEETSRLRESIGGLATGRDVGALEQAMRALVTGVQQAEEPSDLAAIAAPIELIRVQVARLADDVAENVHARVATDVERLAAKVDGALSGDSTGFADRNALSDLFGELDEIRRLIGALAGPERIQSLAHGLQAISAQIAQLQGGVASDGASMAELRPLLEEIRSGLRTPASGGIEEQIQAMGAKLDALREDASAGGGTSSGVIIDRIDALADKVDRAAGNPVGDLIGRLEDLGETLRRPVVPGGDLASIHGMLHDLAEKLDRVGNSSGPRGEGLDSLEKQVLALASRIDTRDADPALAGLERTMTDLLAQVSALRNEAPVIAAQDRATFDAAVAGTGTPEDSGEIGLLKASLADLRAHQAASEQRMQSTLDGVHTALERLVGRLGTIEVGGIAPLDRRMNADTLADRLMAAAAIPAAAVATQPTSSARRQDTARGAKATEPFDLARVSDEPLEPGAGRPGREPVPSVIADPVPAPADNDIKTSFIAAARRAAQAAQNEAAGTDVMPDLRRNGKRAAAEKAGLTFAGRTARLRAELDKRRKPLLLGLAAIVLALGALQAIGSRTSPAPAETTAPVVDQAPSQPSGLAAEPTSKAVQAPAGDAVMGADAVPTPKPTDPAASAPARSDPTTTQSISSAAPPAATDGAVPAAAISASKPARSVVPSVAGVGSLSGDLAAVPTSLAKLRQSALEGDGASVYELAARAGEGRGMPRDFGVAAKLYEKLASAGYAPAQYKLGSFYEKGSGVTRDLVQAKLWYGRAAEQGHARAMHNLAVVYAENPAASGKPDFTVAAQWFRRGAENGMRDSQYNLAVLYARGLGVQQDLVQAYAWFAAAAAQGDDDATKKRDDVASKLAPKDLAAARSFSAAFKAKVPDAAVNEAPAPASVPGAMTLLGAPAPIAAPIPAPPAGRRG